MFCVPGLWQYVWQGTSFIFAKCVWRAYKRLHYAHHAFDTSRIFLLLGYKIKVILKEVWVNVSTQQSFGMFKS